MDRVPRIQLRIPSPSHSDTASFTMMGIDENRRRKSGGPATTSEPRPSDGCHRPLDPEQRAIWDAHDAELGGANHRICVARIPARVEGERLELTLQRLVDRHARLRTTFHLKDGSPVQRTRSSVQFQLEFVDARRWGDRELKDIVRLTSRQPLDLSTSVLRAVLFTRSSTDHTLLLVAHRIAIAPRLLRRLLAEVRALYEGESRPTARLLNPRPDLEQSPSGASLRPRPALGDAVPALLKGAMGLPEAAHALELFSANVRANPHAPALVHGSRRLTYGTLDQEANRLARLLRGYRVDPRTCVAIDLTLSVEAIIVHLAVLKLGAHAVTIRGAEGSAERAVRLRSVRPAALLTRSGNRPSLPVLPPIVVDLDDLAPTLATTSAEPLGTPTEPEAAAVIAHCAGAPPGAVRLTHHAISALLSSLVGRLLLTSDDRVLAPAPLDARSLLLDILLPLSAGATVVLAGAREMTTSEHLLRTLIDERITVLRAPGRTWEALLSAGWTGTPFLRALCDLHELPRQLANRLLQRVDCLWSLYGYLEASFCSAVNPVHGRSVAGAPGDPLSGTQLHLLDDRLRPVGAGSTGVLYVGGVGVARGYLGDPDLTGTRFLPDPFSTAGKGLMFRTGDRAERLDDGTVRLLSRSEIPAVGSNF